MESALQKWLAIFVGLGFAAFLIGGINLRYTDMGKAFLGFLGVMAGSYTAVSGGADMVRANRCNPDDPQPDDKPADH